MIGQRRGISTRATRVVVEATSKLASFKSLVAAEY